MTKLYHYVHCPFCLRVRMTLGYLNIPYKSVVLAYDDEKTPLDLTGVKSLPILEANGQAPINESLDIITFLDRENLLKTQSILSSKKLEAFDQFLSELASPIHNLVMPYWIHTHEFSSSAREYFLGKKEKKRGPFPKLMAKRDQFLKELDPLIARVREWIYEKHHSFDPNEIDLFDIMLASHIWGMYVFPEFQFSPEIHQYLQSVKKKCRFEYHIDYWD